MPALSPDCKSGFVPQQRTTCWMDAGPRNQNKPQQAHEQHKEHFYVSVKIENGDSSKVGNMVRGFMRKTCVKVEQKLSETLRWTRHKNLFKLVSLIWICESWFMLGRVISHHVTWRHAQRSVNCYSRNLSSEDRSPLSPEISLICVTGSSSSLNCLCVCVCSSVYEGLSFEICIKKDEN